MIEKAQTNIYTTSNSVIIQNPIKTKLSITISAYPNCLFAFINDRGTLGSILRGTCDLYQNNCEFDLGNQYDFDQNEKEQKGDKNGGRYVYQIKNLIGSTEIQFYELIMRKLLSLTYEDHEMNLESKGQKSKVILNISLSKIHSSQFAENKHILFQQISNKLKQMLSDVL